jgi:hypothetical protein
VPLFKHGEESQSFLLISQLYPFQPLVQTQLYENVWSKHVPAFRHGADEHSSSSNKQVPTGMSL